MSPPVSSRMRQIRNRCAFRGPGRPCPVRAVLLFVALAVVLIGCHGGADSDQESCVAAVDRFEQLRQDDLETDPVLAKQPMLAAEHVRQTRAAFDASVRASCAVRARRTTG